MYWSMSQVLVGEADEQGHTQVGTLLFLIPELRIKIKPEITKQHDLFLAYLPRQLSIYIDRKTRGSLRETAIGNDSHGLSMHRCLELSLTGQRPLSAPRHVKEVFPSS